MYAGGKLLRLKNGEVSEIEQKDYEKELTSEFPKRTFDLKSLLTETGVEIRNVVFDSTLAAYLLNVNGTEYPLESSRIGYSPEYLSASSSSTSALVE